MKTKILTKIIDKVDKLKYQELVKLKEKIKEIDDKKKVANLLEKDATVTCGHCGASKFVKYGRRNDLQRYKCRKCSKTFNQLTGTPLARLRKKGRWFTYSDCLNKGLTLFESALITEVAESTSFRWRHRLIHNCRNLIPNNLNGVVESANTHFKYSEKGSRNPSNNSIEVNSKAPKIYILSNRDRNNRVTDSIIRSLKIEEVKNRYINLMSKDILYISENNSFYNSIAKKFNLRHGTLNIKKGETIKKQVVHLNNINDYHTRLHDWMKRFRGVATKYLINYISWFRELDEHNMKTPINTRLVRAKTTQIKPYNPVSE
jgi:transposase-like protein